MKIIYTNSATAKDIMQKDEKLLLQLKESDSVILHFYRWKNSSITHGYFLDPKKFFHLDRLQQRGIDIAKRPTGGGIVFHLWDFAFSLLVPAKHPCFFSNTLENYRFVNNIVLQVVQEMFFVNVDNTITLEKQNLVSNFCMACPTKYDVVINGRKIVGAAQRKRNNGYLHQGTISLTHPDEEVLKDILKDSSIIADMQKSSFFLLGKKRFTQNMRQSLEMLLIKHLKKRGC